MLRKIFGAAFLSAAFYVSPGVPGGVERGAREGERAAGPVGSIVGGTIGGVVGGVAGVLGADQRPRFRSYVVEQRRPSCRYQGDVRIGAELPEAGVTYYEVPQEYGVREYRYNDGSGIELRYGLRAAGNPVPVIYMTGNDSPAIRKAALDSGCFAFLTKLFAAQELIEPLRRAVRHPNSADTL